MIGALAAVATFRTSLNAAAKALIAACVLGLTTITLPHANAETDADWAWPGMRYDIYKDNSWYNCSVGFPAWNSAGTRYFISAGHCFRSASGTQYLQPDGAGVEVYAPSDHLTAVGFERTYTIPGGTYEDVSLVEMYPGKRLDGNGWQHIPDNPVNAAVGDQACLVGFKHDTANCGAVTGAGVRQSITGYPWMVDVTTASYCAHPGDSGGAVYNSRGALGIGISADTEHNDGRLQGPCSSSFIPIGRVLDILRHDNPSLTI
jgi:hypothetical protein